jgi:hypothetical protein
LTPTHGYEPTREAAMAAFDKSWPREHEDCTLVAWYRSLRMTTAPFLQSN